MAEYTLPELPYDYAALEPHISAKIMELHHDKHHATYVAGANTALEKLAEARENGTLAAQATKLEKDLAFHLGGHTNHSVFWQNLSPEGGDKRRVTSEQRSTTHSARSTSSASTSPRTRTPSRAPAGRSWHGIRSDSV